MPRTTREWALRELTAVGRNIEWVQTHLAAVIEKYVDREPEIAGNLLTCVELSEVLSDTVKKIRGSI